MNKIKKSQAKPLRRKIRAKMGFEETEKSWFNRESIVKIIKHIDPSATIESDIKNKKYIAAAELFYTYISDWNPQGTVADHPSLLNLKLLYRLIVDAELKDKRTIRDSTTISPDSLIIHKNFEDVSKILNSFPAWVKNRTKNIEFKGPSSSVIISLTEEK